MSRSEFGHARTTCDCNDCKLNCKYVPGYLIPSDLGRLVPPDADPFKWAESNLFASSGALVMDKSTGQQFRVPTLVPSTVGNSYRCHWLDVNDRCSVHADAPFGCAFFDCSMDGPEADKLSSSGIIEIIKCYKSTPPGLYAQLWIYLYENGYRAASPDVRRDAMRREYICQLTGIPPHMIRKSSVDG